MENEEFCHIPYALCTSLCLCVDLKKQSQFAPARMRVTSFLKGDYGNKPAIGAEENKAKQSQFHAPALTKGAGKREKSLAAADSLTGISPNS